MHKLALGSMPIALLVGCTVGPDFSEPAAPDATTYFQDSVQPPAPGGNDVSQRFVLGAKVAGDWWTAFHSAELNRLVEEAIAQNRTLASAKAALRQAQQVAVQAGGALYPQVGFAANAARERYSFASQGENLPASYFNVFSLGPTASFSLDPFGGNRRRLEQATALADSQDYQAVAAFLTLTGQVVVQVLNIASDRDQIDAVHDIVAEDERDLQLVRTESRAGELTQIDIQSAISQLETDRNLLPPLQQELSVAYDALSVLLGKVPSQTKMPELGLVDIELPAELPLTVPSELVHQRPDILSSEAQLHAASAAIGVATAQLYPNLTLSGSMSQEALTLAHLFSPMSNIWSVASGLTAPIFAGGALEAQRAAAVEAYDGALATYEQTVLQSFGQVADVLHALSHDADLLRGQRRALEAAAESLRLVRQTFSFGNVTLLQVLDAERQYAKARLGYAQAKAQRYRDTVQLFVAMGGGWQGWHDSNATESPAKATKTSTSDDARHPQVGRSR